MAWEGAVHALEAGEGPWQTCCLLSPPESHRPHCRVSVTASQISLMEHNMPLSCAHFGPHLTWKATELEGVEPVRQGTK